MTAGDVTVGDVTSLFDNPSSPPGAGAKLLTILGFVKKSLTDFLDALSLAYNYIIKP